MKPRIARKFEQDVRSTQLPDWYPVLQVVVAIAVGLLLFIAMFRTPTTTATPTPAPPPAPTAAPTSTASSSPTPTQTPSPTPSGSSEPTGGNFEIVSTSTGLQLNVPSEAAATGRFAATGLVTGDFGDITINGTDPQVKNPTPGATATAMTVLYASTNSYTFDVEVSANGNTSTHTVVVDLVDGGWSFTPAGEGND